MSYRIWKYAGSPPRTSKSLRLYLDSFGFWREEGEIPAGAVTNSLICGKVVPGIENFLRVNDAYLEPCGGDGVIRSARDCARAGVGADGELVSVGLPKGTVVLQEPGVPGRFWPRNAWVLGLTEPLYNDYVVGGR